MSAAAIADWLADQLAGGPSSVTGSYTDEDVPNVVVLSLRTTDGGPPRGRYLLTVTEAEENGPALRGPHRGTSEAYVRHHDTPLGAALAVVADELTWAQSHFAPFNSGHEGKAAIEEELDELWELVKADRTDTLNASREAAQIAAMGLRFLLELGDPLRLYEVGMRPKRQELA